MSVTIGGMSKTAPIRVSARIARMIDVICTAESTTASAICDPLLEAAIKKRYLEALRTLNREAEEPIEKPRK